MKNRRNHSSTAKHFNMIQFHDKYYSDFETNHDTIIQLRFPNGWTCPECGYTEYNGLKTRNCIQRNIVCISNGEHGSV